MLYQLSDGMITKTLHRECPIQLTCRTLRQVEPAGCRVRRRKRIHVGVDKGLVNIAMIEFSEFSIRCLSIARSGWGKHRHDPAPRKGLVAGLL